MPVKLILEGWDVLYPFENTSCPRFLVSGHCGLSSGVASNSYRLIHREYSSLIPLKGHGHTRRVGGRRVVALIACHAVPSNRGNLQVTT